MSSNCTFNDIERISICNGGASDHVEVANQDDSRVAPNTISWWHDLSSLGGDVNFPLVVLITPKISQFLLLVSSGPIMY